VTAAAKKRTRIRRRWRWESWRRHRVLYICCIVSALVHLMAIVSFSPWWLGKTPRVKPRKTKVVSLKIKPRPARPRPPVKAPPKPEVVRPVPTQPPPKPIYTTRELERKLEKVRSEEVLKKFTQPKTVRAEEVFQRKQKEARRWVEREFDSLEKSIEREEVGEVGYSRVIDLKKSSDYQVGRLMDHFDMSVEFGRRKVTDFNIRFSSEWTFTPGQVRNYISRHAGSDSRKILDAFPGGEAEVELTESGEGHPRPYIAPTVDAIAAIIMAEEKYFSETGTDPEEIERVVFSPAWTYKGPAFEVTKVEKKTAGTGQTPGADKEESDTTAILR